MLLIIGMKSISVTCYDSIYVIFLLLPTYNIYRVSIVLVYIRKPISKGESMLFCFLKNQTII